MGKNINIRIDASKVKDPIEAALQARGVKDIEGFLDPPVSWIHDWSCFENIEKAQNIVIEGIKQRKNFFINVDSDTDGVMSGTIMYRWLRASGIEPTWHVSQGKSHGTSETLLKKLEDLQPDILIIVDSLDSDLVNYKKIKDMGIQIIVLDHHNVDKKIDYSSCITLVSSNMNYPNPALSGSGVTWKFCWSLDEQLGTYDSDHLIDFAATGIVADVMDMTDCENRAIVRAGLNNLNSKAIKRICGSYEFNCESIIFSVAPLINAACRYSQNDAAFQLFIEEDEKKMDGYRKILNKCKTAQTKEIDSLEKSIEEQVEKQKDWNFLFITIKTENGISGLVANQVATKYRKPTLVVREEKERYAGSGRAPDAMDFRQLCEDTGHCLALGHEEAFGFFLNYEDTSAFLTSLDEELANATPSKEIEVDILIRPEQVTKELIDKNKYVNRIIGKNFPALRYVIESDEYTIKELSKGKHFCLEEHSGIKFIKWNQGYLNQEFEDHAFFGDKMRFYGTLSMSYFGREPSINLILDGWEMVE